MNIVSYEVSTQRGHGQTVARRGAMLRGGSRSENGGDVMRLGVLLVVCSTALMTCACSSAPERDTAAFLTGVKDVQTRTGYDDAKVLEIGDAMCGMAKASTTDAVYMLQLDQAMRTTEIPGTGGSMELALLSGNALAHLCPSEGDRLRK